MCRNYYISNAEEVNRELINKGGNYMTLKKATLIAIIGSILHIISQTFYVLNHFDVYEFSISIFKLLSILNLISSIFLIIFFFTLYSNQNDRKKQKGEV